MERNPRSSSRRRRLAVAGVTGAALLGLATLAAAQPGPRAHACGPGRGPGHMGPAGGGPRHAARQFADHLLAAAEELDLTEAQRDKLRAVRRSAPAALMPKRQALAEARMDLHDLMAKKDADAAGLRKAHDKVVKARADVESAMFDLRLQAREVLTPEQRQKLKDEMRPRARRGAGRMGEADLDDEMDFGLGFGPGLGFDAGFGPDAGFAPEAGEDLDPVPSEPEQF